MNPQKAIPILTTIKSDLFTHLVDDDLEAIQLGIEALESICVSRTRPVPYNIAPLPSETKD